MANPVSLPPSVSLPDELAAALAAGSPLVVMVSLEGCPFCKIVRESYLAPMRQEQRLPVVQVDMRSQRSVKNFSGSATTHEALIAAWRIELAPTVLFLGRQGVEVAQRLVGGYIPDFYGAYLEQRLELARRTVGKGT
jgi:thioredoxin-related protein